MLSSYYGFYREHFLLKAWLRPILLLHISMHLGIALKHEHSLGTSLSAAL